MKEENVLKLQKVSSVRIFEQAVEQIRNLILNGDIAPGQKLPTEHELCSQLNASRTSIREALRVLEAEGLVEVKRGSGTYVTMQPSTSWSKNEMVQWLGSHEQTVEQILEVRESIEGLTAALTAQRATQSALNEISAILAEQTQVIERNDLSQDEKFNNLAILDAKFHLAISNASGNDFANEIVSRIVPAFTQSNKAILFVSQRMQTTEDEHQEIYHALVEKDAQAAEKAMRKHLLRVRNEIIQIQKETDA